MDNIQIVSQILASDIIGWFLAFFGGFIVFKIVDNMQINIERHSMIREIESSVNSLFSSLIAKSNTNIDSKYVNIRTILHDFSPWKDFDSSETIIENGQRYVCIRKDDKYEEYISTQGLHESLIIFRRIEKLYKDSILKPIDLADLWREILPFAASKRLEFYKNYFSKYDIEPIVFVLFNTFLACKKYKVNNAVIYFNDVYNNDESIKYYFEDNGRYRIRERIRLRHFYNQVRK